MNWKVRFAPEAPGQLQTLEERIAQAGAPITAERYVDAIVDFCMSLQTFAARGVARGDPRRPVAGTPNYAFPQARSSPTCWTM